jgi:hypothetical protein
MAFLLAFYLAVLVLKLLDYHQNKIYSFIPPIFFIIYNKDNCC